SGDTGGALDIDGGCLTGGAAGITTVAAGQQRCPLCNKGLSRWTSLRRHIEDKHTQGGAHICPICYHVYRTKNSLHNHLSVYHRGATGSRGRRGRYPSYTVLRPTNAHQLAALKAAARHTARDVPGTAQGMPREALAVHQHQLPAASSALEESEEQRQAVQQAAPCRQHLQPRCRRRLSHHFQHPRRRHLWR
ncbi:hypothetical protein OTU49_017532, partial [Cherax quadricarinatus]